MSASAGGEPEAAPPDTADPRRAYRRLEDARTLRALAHPLRIALLEALAVDGPLTATEVSELVGESPTTCSFHLRQLARYGFIEEGERGPGRRRPWRMVARANTIPRQGEDDAATIEAEVLGGILRRRLMEHLERWEATGPTYPPEWQAVAETNQFILFVTLEEMEEVQRRLHTLMGEFMTRLDPAKRPRGTVPVEVITFAFPVRLPGGEDAGKGRRK
ncbi:MAG: ArsR/SmtB family transcription factor [Candidatus Dormibacteria bacterium]